MLILYIFGSLILGTIVCLSSKKEIWIAQITFASAIVCSIVTASKISPLYNSTGYVSVAIGLYSMTFLITDYLGEIHGKQAALRAVYMGFIAAIISVGIFYVTILMPSAPFWQSQAAYEEVFGTAPRILAASLIAVFAAQYLDVIVFHYLKKRSNEKHLYIRNNASTFISQTTDSLIFYTIAFYGVMSNSQLLNLILLTCLVKYAIAILDTPFLYFIRHMHNK